MLSSGCGPGRRAKLCDTLIWREPVRFQSSIRICLYDEVAPFEILIMDLGQPKLLDSKRINSSLAFPSTGGDFRNAFQVPSSISVSSLRFAFGFTLIDIFLTRNWRLGCLAAWVRDLSASGTAKGISGFQHRQPARMGDGTLGFSCGSESTDRVRPCYSETS